jgi:hypothetical protein
VTKFFVDSWCIVYLLFIYRILIETKTEFCPPKKKGLEEIVGKTGTYKNSELNKCHLILMCLVL